MLKNYKVVKRIGKGAYGWVYQVTWNSDDKIFALKTLDISTMDEKGIKNCLNEIWIICSIDDEFICGYEEAFTL